MRRVLLFAVAAAVAALAATPAIAHPGEGLKTWRVTIKNLTPPGAGAPGSQPLSPPLFVIHSNRADLWSVGAIASHPVAAIAEDANNSPAESAFGDLRGVRTVFTGAGGPIASGEERTYTIQTAGNFDRLTILTMLVNTNDAFTGLDSRHLDEERIVRRKMAYDAGSELNNELAAFIPGPCCGNAFVRAPEGKLIRLHEGITGRGDLDPALYDWEGPAARITVQRVEN